MSRKILILLDLKPSEWCMFIFGEVGGPCKFAKSQIT